MDIYDIAPVLQELARGYYLKQVLVILLLYMVGFTFVCLVGKKIPFIWKCLLAYPLGLSLWGLVSFFLLILNIPYRLEVVGAIFILIFSGALLWFFKSPGGITLFSGRKRLLYLLVFSMVVFGAMLATSDILSVSISNDSVYYYSVYSQIIAENGKYLASYDVFLTDAGQMTAIINCLPYFFGFDHSFGIQQFLNLNFLVLFFTAVYEMARKKMELRSSVITGIMATAFLAMATPFLVMSEWVLANVYFMDFMFLIFYLGYRFGQEEKKESAYLVIMGILTAMLSMMRMEGGIMACLLILCISCQNYRNKELLTVFVLPVGIMQLVYYIKIFAILGVKPLYSFLDIKKAAVMMALLLCVGIYIGWFRGKRLRKIQEYMELVILLGLVLANIGLFGLNTQRYMTNLKCFGENIILQNGWGYFGFFVLILLLILPWKHRKIQYPDLFWMGYILFTLAVSWARGATLRVGIGDSGNRVMMQIIPFVVFALAVRIIDLLADKPCHSPHQ